MEGSQRRFICIITVRRSKYCPQISKARLNISGNRSIPVFLLTYPWLLECVWSSHFIKAKRPLEFFNRPFYLACFVFRLQTTWTVSFNCRLMHVYSHAYVCILMKRQKANSLKSITWSELGKQNIQVKKVY